MAFTAGLSHVGGGGVCSASLAFASARFLRNFRGFGGCRYTFLNRWPQEPRAANDGQPAAVDTPCQDEELADRSNRPVSVVAASIDFARAACNAVHPPPFECFQRVKIPRDSKWPSRSSPQDEGFRWPKLTRRNFYLGGLVGAVVGDGVGAGGTVGAVEGALDGAVVGAPGPPPPGLDCAKTSVGTATEITTGVTQTAAFRTSRRLRDVAPPSVDAEDCVS